MKNIDQRVAMLASRQHGAFSRRQVMTTGASSGSCDRRVAGGAWWSTAWEGVYVLAGYPPSWRQRLMSAVLAGAPATMASHRSAAVLHGLRDGSEIEVTVPVGASARRGHAAIHRRPIAAADRDEVDGIAATAVDRTICDLAGVVSPDEVEHAIETALRRQLTSVDRLRRRLDQLASPGRPGVRRLRRVLDQRGPGGAAGSRLEVRLRQVLRAAGLPEPVRQHEVLVGGQRYLLDLAYPDRRLAIELDGREFHDDGTAFQRDRTRQNALVLAGWTVLRFTWADVFQRADDCVAVVVGVLAAA